MTETRKGRVTRMEPGGGGVRRTVVYQVRTGRAPGILATVAGVAVLGGLLVVGLLTAVVALWIALGVVAAGVAIAIVRAVLGSGAQRKG